MKQVKEPAILLQGNKYEQITVAEAVPGRLVKEDDSSFVLIKRYIDEIIHYGDDVVKNYRPLFKGSKMNLFEDSGQKFKPEDLLFIDLETCGLAASPIFLIGLSYYTGKSFAFVQLFARNYSEEKAMLKFYNKFIDSFKAYVTYNGRAFDIPFLRSRFVEHGIMPPKNLENIDLLLEVRRAWKSDMPNCKLQTVEKYKLQRMRTDDIPGENIPFAYNEYVITGESKLVEPIIKHNLFDILSMIEILIKIRN